MAEDRGDGRHGASAGEKRPTVRLLLLAGFELELSGHSVDIQPAAQRILAFLALANAPVSRRSTAAQLWPDAAEDRAKANLRSALWRVRQVSHALVRCSTSYIRLSSEVWVDAHESLHELAPVDREQVWEELQTRAVLQEDLLPEWYDDWLVTERERVRQLRLHAFEQRALQLIREERISEAIQVGLRTVAADPLRESAHRIVVLAHLAEGNLSEAVDQYDRMVDLLDRQLGVPPSERMQELIAPWIPQPGGRPEPSRTAGKCGQQRGGPEIDGPRRALRRCW